MQRDSGERTAPPKLSGRLLPILLLASIMPVLSWVNPFLTRWLEIFFGMQENGLQAWAIYTYFRLAMFALLVWCILRLSSNSVSTRKSGIGTNTSRFDPLMALRALAALMVVLGHYFINFAFPIPVTPLHRTAIVLLRSCPWAGVWIFFTLSGYLMGKGFATGRYTLSDGSVRSFYRNRLVRIAPLYYGAMLLTYPFLAPQVLIPRNWWQWIEVAIFDYRGDLPNNPVGVLWSISTEVQFYLLAPFLFLLLFRIRSRTGKFFAATPLLILFGGLLLRHLALYVVARVPAPAGTQPLSTFVYPPLLTNLDLFLTGMAIAMLPLQEKWKRMRPRTATVLLLCIPLVLCTVTAIAADMASRQSLWIMQGGRFWLLIPPFTAILSAVFILAAETHGMVPLQPRASHRLLASIQQIGVLTYAIYVTHTLIYRFLRGEFPAALLRERVSLGMLPVVFASVLIVSAIAYYGVERPFEIRKKVTGTPLTDAP